MEESKWWSRPVIVIAQLLYSVFVYHNGNLTKVSNSHLMTAYDALNNWEVKETNEDKVIKAKPATEFFDSECCKYLGKLPNISHTLQPKDENFKTYQHS